MTIDELLGKSADEIEAFLDADAEALFKPLYTVTRPEQAPKPASFNKVSKEEIEAVALAKQHGFDLSWILDKSKKRK